MLRIDRIVEEQAESLALLLSQVALRQSPSAYYDNLLGYLAGMCARIRDEVSQEIALSATTEEERLARDQLLVFCSEALRSIHFYVECFEHADELTAPAPMMQLLRRMGDRLSIAKPFLLKGSTEFNYTYWPVGRDLNRLAAGIPGDLGVLDSHFAVFSFPMSLKRDMLSSCALAHEFGHLVVDSKGLVEDVGSRLAPEEQRRMAEILERHARTGVQIDFEIATRVNYANHVLANWIHETLADSIGLLLFGPAHFYTFIYWVIPMGSYGADDVEHPSTSYRLGLMLRGLEALGWTDTVRIDGDDSWQQAEQMSGLPRPSDDYRFQAASECMALMEDVVWQVAQDCCGAAWFAPQDYTSAQDRMHGLLQRGIPPAELLVPGAQRFDPAHPVAILNAAWDFYRKGFPEWDSCFPSLSRCERRAFVNRLAVKAMEVAFVLAAQHQLESGEQG